MANLYAWSRTTTKSEPSVIYTLSTAPEVGTYPYDETGVQYSLIFLKISEVDTNLSYIETGNAAVGYTYNRDSSKDILDTPSTPDEKIAAVYTQMQNIKTAINTKAGSTVVGDNTSEYASAIGQFKQGYKNITREISSTGVYQTPASSFTFTLPSAATDVGYYALKCAFAFCSRLTSADLSSLTAISGTYALSDAFTNCTSLTSVDLSNLTTVSGSGALQGAFVNCTALTDIYFSALTTSSFGYYTDQFSGMLYKTGTTVTHTLHFPSNMESTISTLEGYPTFYGTSGYVILAYDLPATS